MRRDLSTPVLPVPFPIGIVLTPYTRNVAIASRYMMQRAYPEGLGDSGISFDGFWTWLTTDPEYDPALMFAAMADGVVIGHCHCWSGAFVKDLVVDANFRGLGLGTALLTKALKTFQDRAAHWVDLKTEADNLQAQSLYRRLGFVVVEHIHD